MERDRKQAKGRSAMAASWMLQGNRQPQLGRHCDRHRDVCSHDDHSPPRAHTALTAFRKHPHTVQGGFEPACSVDTAAQRVL